MTAPMVTIFPDNKGAQIKTAGPLSLSELEVVIRTTPPARAKGELPLLKLARFGKAKTAKGCLRHDDNAVEVHGVEGDYDGEKMPMADAVERCRQAGIAALFYTSASHTPERPRWRAVCPLATLLKGTPDQLRQQRKHWVGVLNAILGSVLKAESFALSQSFYFGRIKGQPDPEIVRLEGVCIDELADPPAPIIPVSGNGQVPDHAPLSMDQSSDWPSLELYDGDGSRHLLACVRIARLQKHLGGEAIHKLFDDHPHAQRQTDPRRAVQRCIDKIDSEQAQAGDVLEGIDDSRVVTLLRPLVDSGAIPVASDHVPHSVAARITLRAMRDALFSQGGQVVEIAKSKSGVSIQPVREQALASRVDRMHSVVRVYQKSGRFSVGPCRLSASGAGVVLASQAVREELHEIELVLRRPIAVEHDAQLVTLVPGFNEGVGVYVVGGQTIPEVPLQEAVASLLALLDGFLFASDADRSRGVGSMVLPALVLGRMLDGHAPLIYNEGDQSQAAKTLKAAMDAALYGEQGQLVAQKERGGVGSMDEAFSEALLRGLPFIRFDNFRGEFNSPFLEAVITAGKDPIACRVPYRGQVWVDASRFIFQMTSNGAVLTPDQANRILVVRLVRRPEGYTFRSYPEGSLLKHVQKNQPFYAGCIQAAVRRWFDAGKPRNPVPHTFEEMGSIDWIVQEVFGLGPLLEAHREIVARLSSPEDGFIRTVVLEMERQQRMRRWVLASSLVDAARTGGFAPTGGWHEGADEANRQMGRLLARVFAQSEVRDFGHLRMRRDTSGTYDFKPTKRYCVWRPADGPPPEPDDDEAPL